MEEYKKLLWSRHNPRSEGKLLEQASIDFALFQDDIFNLHINEIDPIHQIEDMQTEDTGTSLPVELPVDPRTGEKVQQLKLICVQPLCLFESFPSGSVLTREEHQHCLSVLNRINMRRPFNNPGEKKNYQKYRKLMEKLAPESEMFESFVRNYFNTNLLRRMQTIDPDLNSLVVEVWQEKVKELLASDRDPIGRYILMTVVPSIAYVENETNVSFEPTNQDVRETGSVRNLFTENVLRCVSLKRSQRFLNGFLDEWRGVRRRRDDGLADMYSVLQGMPDVSVVLPAGTFAFLLNHVQNAQEQWSVPFEVKMIEDRKVLIMDNRHPPCRMSTHARKVRAYKMLVRSFTTFLRPKQANESSRASAVNDGTESASKEFKVHSIDEYMKKVELKKSSAQNQIRENRFYQAWRLRDQDEEHRLLVCFRQDCYESFCKMRVFMNISVKLEYQPEFGAEQMTLAELLHEWSRQLLRPNSKTMRLRINAATSTIISHHYLELRDIEEELNRLYGVKPRNLITSVWKTLKLMQLFPTGEYLLQRDGKSTQGPSVYAKTTGEKLDHSETGAVTTKWGDLLRNPEYDCPLLEQYDWIPIDKFVITYLHRTKTLLPCSFPHWRSVRRLNPRQIQKKPKDVSPTPTGAKKGPKNKAAPPTEGNQSSRTPAQKMRRAKTRVRKQAARKQKALANNIQKSLNQFAPYSGPAKTHGVEKADDLKGALGTLATLGSEKTGTALPLASHTSSAVLDYHSYVEQAAIAPDEKV